LLKLRKGDKFAAVIISKIHFFERTTWEDNDWYKCPKCSFTSLDAGFKYCPSCGDKLKWELNK